MNRHFEYFARRRFSEFLKQECAQWSIEDIAGQIELASALLAVFYRQDSAISLFAMKNGFSELSLEERELLWLFSVRGVGEFVPHYTALIPSRNHGVSEDEQLELRIRLQMFIFHDQKHVYLVGLGQGRQPTDKDLAGDTFYKWRVSLRFFSFLYGVDTYRERAKKEFLKLEKQDEESGLELQKRILRILERLPDCDRLVSIGTTGVV